MSAQRVAIVGTGLIGSSWAVHFLARGLDVIASDPAAGAEERLREYVARHSETAARLAPAPAGPAGQLTFVADARDAVRDAGFIQESGPERPGVKRALLAALDEVAPPGVVIASSSSGLLPSEIQADCRHADRVLVGHPFNPPHVIPLVEVVGGQRTSHDTVEAAMAFYRDAGKRPIHVRKEVIGHVANRLQAAVWREAYGLVLDDVVDVEDIDIAMTDGPGLRWALLGPFAIQMLAGGAGGMRHSLEHLGAALDDWWLDLHQTRLTDDVKETIIAASAERMADQDPEDLIAARDALLVELLLRKRETRGLP